MRRDRSTKPFNFIIYHLAQILCSLGTRTLVVDDDDGGRVRWQLIKTINLCLR